jgi:uncharacterized protein YkwD
MLAGGLSVIRRYEREVSPLAHRHRRPRGGIRPGTIGVGLVTAVAVGFGVNQATGWPAPRITSAAATAPAEDSPSPDAAQPDAAEPDTGRPGMPGPDPRRSGATADTAPAQRARPGRDPSPGAATSSTGARRRGTAARLARADDLSAEVAALVNAQRTAARFGPVRPDPRLRAAAQRHAADMAARRTLDARSAAGEAPWEQAWAQRYYFYAGQTIARGQVTAAAVVDAWMGDLDDRSVLLDCGSTAVGVAARSGGDGPWWTAMFGYHSEGVN